MVTRGRLRGVILYERKSAFPRRERMALFRFARWAHPKSCGMWGNEG